MSFKVLFCFTLLALVAVQWSYTEALICHPSCQLRGKKPPPGQCNRGNDSDCCKEGKMYPIYKCSPPVSTHTKATLTINSFKKGKDGGGPSECDNQYHSDSSPIVALSTGRYNHGSRCHKYITIKGNGRSVRAKVVDECDSTVGCDYEHSYQPPCNSDIFLMHRVLSGKPWGCLRTVISGIGWILLGLMLSDEYHDAGKAVVL